MTDEAKALVEQVVNETRKIVEEEYVKVMAAMTQSQIETAEKAIKERTDLIETQAREIERLQGLVSSYRLQIDQLHDRAALAGDSHDQ